MIAMAQHDAPQVDLEALQAQINLSMSLTEELVSSWIRPVANNLAKSGQSSKNPEKDLQEYLRRPPRLGVGAPIPESSGAVERETIKLKHKLAANHKRRRGDDERISEKGDEDDETVERKGGSITKKARLDPFAMPGKKKRMAALASIPETKAKLTSGGTVVENMPERITVNGAERANNPTNQTNASSGQSGRGPLKALKDVSIEGSSSLISEKRRKKKKKFTLAARAEKLDTEPPSVSISAMSHAGPVGVEEEEWAGFEDSDDSKMTPGVGELDSTTRDKIPSAASAKTPTMSLTTPRTPGLQISSRTSSGPPLLNLRGPPLSDTEDTASMSQIGLSPTSKKKRRRSRKKQRNADGTPSKPSAS